MTAGRPRPRGRGHEPVDPEAREHGPAGIVGDRLLVGDVHAIGGSGQRSVDREVALDVGVAARVDRGHVEDRDVERERPNLHDPLTGERVGHLAQVLVDRGQIGVEGRPGRERRDAARRGLERAQQRALRPLDELDRVLLAASAIARREARAIQRYPGAMQGPDTASREQQLDVERPQEGHHD